MHFGSLGTWIALQAKFEVRRYILLYFFFCQGCCTCIYLDKCSLFNNTKHMGACILMLWLPEETEFSNKGVPLYLVNNNYSFEKKSLFNYLFNTTFQTSLSWASVPDRFELNIINILLAYAYCWLFTFEFLFYRDTASGGNTVSNFI